MNPQQQLKKWKQKGLIPQSWTSASCEDVGESHSFVYAEYNDGFDGHVCEKCGYEGVG